MIGPGEKDEEGPVEDGDRHAEDDPEEEAIHEVKLAAQAPPSREEDVHQEETRKEEGEDEEGELQDHVRAMSGADI